MFENLINFKAENIQIGDEGNRIKQGMHACRYTCTCECLCELMGCNKKSTKIGKGER